MHFLLISLVGIFGFLAPSTAFLPQRVGAGGTRKQLLAHRDGPMGDARFFDLDAERLRLEAMMMGEQIENGRESAAVQAPQSKAAYFAEPAPPLTQINRERRMVEIQLLATLGAGDEGRDELLALWHNERGPIAAQQLDEAQQSLDRRAWGVAEIQLKALIKQYGIHWAEPVNTLATLYYLQGRLEESRELCELVLQVKPWHFEALSGIVKVFHDLKDYGEAGSWAAKRLPKLQPTGSNRRRAQWVERVVRDARNQLHQAEEHLRAWYEGRQHQVQSQQEEHAASSFDSGDDAWQ